MGRTYEEPISFIAQADKASSVKPKEIMVKLCQDPTDPNSDEVSKTFTEFVGTTPEAYCQWMCDMEEYIRGKGIVTPAATITASQQLLSVAGIMPNGPVTTVQEVQQTYNAFALTFMDRTARCKQKRYMASGSIQKPKSWSSQQVTTRLTMLNHYLTYLPGTAQAFTDDEMKDMLVDMHSPAYHHLMARANYDIDAHSYLETTQYLQNLGLIEE
jgi:hypothetical protein